MKKTIISFLMFTLPLFAQMKGDMNEDMIINILDVVQVVNIALGMEATEYELWAADVNTDETINVLDVVQVVNFALGSGCSDGFYPCEEICCADSFFVEWHDWGLSGVKIWKLRKYENYLYVCAGTQGLWRRRIEDLNSNWEFLGLSDSTQENNSIMFGVQDVIVDNENRILCNSLPLSTSEHGVFASMDEGGSWITCDDGLEAEGGTGYYFLYRFQKLSDNSILGASGPIFSISEIGDPWHMISSIVPSNLGFSLDFAVCLSNEQIMWIGGMNIFDMGFVSKSVDKGETWSSIDFNGLIPAENTIKEIEINPDNADEVFLVSYGSVLKTEDGGENWEISLNEMGCSDIIIHPDFSNHVFVITNNQILHSNNNGNNWSEIETPEIPCVLQILIDSTTNRLFVGTENGVFFYDLFEG